MSKINGQIWIDSNSPYNLKYRYNNMNFTVEVKQTYELPENFEYNTGNVIAIDTDGSFKLASFPQDINNIDGIAYINDNNLTIVKNGEITLNEYDFENCFYKNIKITDINEGDVIYWATTCYGDDNPTSGLLTVYQPNGLKNYENVTDYRYNVSYDNLPVVGIVKEKKNTSIVINVLIQKYDSTLEWSWPKISKDSDVDHTNFCGFYKSGNNEIEIFHGLFNGSNKCFNDITITSIDENNMEYMSLAKSSNNYDIGSTKVIIKSIEDLRYFINGEVHYNITRG